MGKLDLTDAEAEFVNALARDRHGVMSRLSFYSAVLVPTFGFGAHGAYVKNPTELFVAFCGLSFFVLWRIAQEFRYIDPYKTLFRKIVEHQNEESQKGSVNGPD